MSNSAWALTITCPRPASRGRVGDDWHVQPHRVREKTAIFFGKNAEVTLMPRTVRLHATGTGRWTGDLDLVHERFANVLTSLFMDVQFDRKSRYILPRPVRTELRQDDK